MTRSAARERWERVQAVLDEALALPIGERLERLEDLCGGDDELAAEVRSLLEADAAAAGFLEDGAEAYAAPYLSDLDPDGVESAVGQRIGPYRIVREIGRGGMGAVYLAERADGQFEHRVAIKLVKRGMDTDEIVRRFLRERQILASLQHPHIARLLDGGVTEDGRPYLVMEYVVGTPITEYCEERDLPIEDRLRLFVTVCRAFHFAHTNLVVHRDIKPSNVLVDESGEIKLLDFGVARLLDEEGEGVTVTVVRRLMTPEYASPEQVFGEPVTTASDVYQLGTLLYELLSGDKPYRITRRRPRDVERALSGPAPRRPSAMAPPAVARVLRGDLDTIVMAAIRRTPDRRYRSAEALAEDVERHLAGRPVEAAPDSVLYRARKFARRHRVVLAMAAIFVGLLVSFGAVYTLQMKKERDRARLEAAKAVQSAGLLQQFFENWDPDAADRGEVRAEDLLRVGALRTERELAEQPEVQAATLSLLGGLYANLELFDEADSLLSVALARQRGLHPEPHPDVAATLERRGRLRHTRGDYVASERALREAIAIYESVFDRSSRDALRTRLALADGLLQGQERFAEAEATYRRILEFHGDDPDDPSLVFADASRGLGLTLFYQARYAEAEAILRPALERNRRLFGEVHPVTVLTLQALGATVRDLGKVEEAVGLQRDVVRINQALYGGEHPHTLFSKFVLAFNLHRAGAFEEARDASLEVVAWTTERNGPRHPQTGRYVRFHAYVLLDLGETREAERLLRQALGIYRAAYPHRHADEAGILNRLAWLLVERGAPDATAVYGEAVRAHRESAGNPVFVTYGPHYLARAMERMGDGEEAARVYARSLELYRAQLPAGHPYRVDAERWGGALVSTSGRQGRR